MKFQENSVEDEERRPPVPVEFCIDSTYAINVGTGKWILGTTNRELGRRLRNAVTRLRRDRGTSNVRFTHVRSHTRVVGNVAADYLANAARKDASIRGDGLEILKIARQGMCSASRQTPAPPTGVGSGSAGPVVQSRLGQELGVG